MVGDSSDPRVPPVFHAHALEWDREASARFWDHQGSDRRRQVHYFSRQVGDALLDYVARRVPPDGRVLDLGCGPGFLLEKMLDRGFDCVGSDFSDGSLDMLRERLDGRIRPEDIVHAAGYPLPFADGAFRTVFLVETVEHLLPADLDATMREVARLLSSGGHVVLTTPYAEELEARQVMCPECGAVFHSRQHVSSWNTDSISALLARAGFRVASADATTLRAPSALNPARALMARIRHTPPRHLVAIGTRP